ncbi:MAG: hypothetical protein ACR2RF_25020 [Geminicoccaceae bacterium]
MAIKQLSDGNPSGALLGQSSTDLIGFYGLTTPIARPSITAVATATATTTLNETKIDRLYTALRNLGLVDTGG